MAINISFNGATIYKPGAYSKTEIDLSGGFPLGPTGLVAIFGESDAGSPGASEVNIANNFFTADQAAAIRAKYGSGPIVDACNLLFAPGADGAIPGGAQAVYIYKTNASVQAILDPIEAGAVSFGRLRARQWGISGNQITFKSAITPEEVATVTSSAIAFPVSIVTGTNDTFSFQLDGGAATTITLTGSSGPGTDYNSATELATEFNNQFAANSLLAIGDDAANTITIKMDPLANGHRTGTGRSFMITNGNANATCGFTDYTFATAVAEPLATLSVKDQVSTLVESATVGGDIALMVGRDNSGGATTATIQITDTSVILTQAGASPSTYTIPKANFATIQTLADYISSLPGWTATAGSNSVGLQPVSSLDQVAATGALYLGTTARQPARIKRDAAAVAEFFSLSTMVELIPAASASSVKKVGLPDQQGVTTALYLSGGARGGTSSAEITTALSKFEKIRVNSVVPLFSRDASQDILDGFTDATSTYTIDAIHQAVKSHCNLMATTKKRSERQGYLSCKASYETCKDKIFTMADARLQMAIQDIRQVDSAGNITWLLPWAGACLLAGARGGSPVGNPLTFKYFNITGIRQTGQLMSTPEANIVVDFDPDTQYDDAIQSGVTFWEAPQTGGFRLVVDNTTYGKDGNWVYNRAHVLYAADVLAYDFRNQLENIYVGLKNTVSAAEIKATCESILTTYLVQGITVSTPDAKSGFKQLVVQINGNVVNISVVVKLVESIDFVLADISLQRVQQTA